MRGTRPRVNLLPANSFSSSEVSSPWGVKSWSAPPPTAGAAPLTACPKEPPPVAGGVADETPNPEAEKLNSEAGTPNTGASLLADGAPKEELAKEKEAGAGAEPPLKEKDDAVGAEPPLSDAAAGAEPLLKEKDAAEGAEPLLSDTSAGAEPLLKEKDSAEGTEPKPAGPAGEAAEPKPVLTAACDPSAPKPAPKTEPVVENPRDVD